MSKVYVNPMAMRARLAAELATMDLSEIVAGSVLRLIDAGHAAGGNLPDLLVSETHTSMVAMLNAVDRVDTMSADELGQLMLAFEGTGELVVQLLAERHPVEGMLVNDLDVTGMLLLAMYGALSLASREANANSDYEECLA
ncbi:hypothetical protein [Aeromonas salmonicida]|uniref:hypothetical protein n=1 Tax=Aeromonas salmonicida TaxID=645 RepID=UPI000F76FFF9|nr:hypothetical protein [Aeromonas salmonicida]RSM31236.1 hypothetical protein C5B77_10090 [Aeromonas salmonicida]